METALFPTPLGWVGAAARRLPDPGAGWALVRMVLPEPSAEEAGGQIALRCRGFDATPAADPLPGWARALSAELREYLAGKRRVFSLPLDLSDTDGFRRRVLELTREIPYGETRTYTWLATQAGQPRGARAAGHAMATNPLPILIPCHRVVGARGSLTGYLGGLEMKHRLLQMEGGILL